MVKSGIKINNIILSGGASQNLPLCQIISDVLQMPLDISAEMEASSKGCFILIKAAIEKNQNYKEVFLSLSPEKEMISPEPGNAAVYDEIYRKYIKLGDLLEQIQE